jgi:multidrug efflux pump
MSQVALETEGVEHAVAFPGLSIAGLSNSSNAGIVFVTLKPFEERKGKELYGAAIVATLNAKFGVIQDAFVAIFPPPPVQGLGTIGGFKLYIEDRADVGLGPLDEGTQAFLDAGRKSPELAGLFSGYQVNVPQLFADVDRTKAKTYGVALTDVFDTMQAYLGSLYVNDFNPFGRTFQVARLGSGRPRGSADPRLRHQERSGTPVAAQLTISGGPDPCPRVSTPVPSGPDDARTRS